MNKKISTTTGTIIIVIIAIMIGAVVSKYEKSNEEVVSQMPNIAPQQNQKTQEAGNNQESGATDSIKAWKTYQNKDIGLLFDYPANWGDVVIENGNKDNIGIPPCEKPLPMMTNLEKKYQWGLYSVALRFSSAPISLEIKLLDLDFPNNPKIVCNFKGDAIKISTIQPKIQTDNILVTNKSGIKFISDPSLFNSLNTSLDGPTYTTRYKNKLVWIGAAFAPHAGTAEEAEIQEKYTCNKGDYYNTEKGCGIIAWYQNGKTSEKARVAFDDLKELVQTFALDK
ncbi:MAG: hypothetical protein EOM84_02805 [Sphingobacteriia bacterium]|jgi:hypothetical protein|nr:hypothetical protein [Sphingobacteriia bacterium]